MPKLKDNEWQLQHGFLRSVCCDPLLESNIVCQVQNGSYVSKLHQNQKIKLHFWNWIVSSIRSRFMHDVSCCVVFYLSMVSFQRHHNLIIKIHIEIHVWKTQYYLKSNKIIIMSNVSKLKFNWKFNWIVIYIIIGIMIHFSTFCKVSNVTTCSKNHNFEFSSN